MAKKTECFMIHDISPIRNSPKSMFKVLCHLFYNNDIASYIRYSRVVTIKGVAFNYISSYM